MKTRRVLVTGATGFIGSHVTRSLLGHGYEVAILLRASSSLARLADVAGRLTQIHGELGQLDRAADQIHRFRPETVVHLAWEGVAGSRSDEAVQFSVNVPGTWDLVRIAGGAGCRSWIGLGSQAEYPAVPGILTEDTPPNPDGPYGLAKYMCLVTAQHLCGSYGMRLVWLRLFAAYGPDEDPRWFIPSTIETLLRRRRPALSQGDQLVDYLYVEDLAEAVTATVVSSCHGVYNLASGESFSVREIAGTIRDLIDPSLPLGFAERSAGAESIRSVRADISKLIAATGWRPRTSLREGLARTVSWHKAHATVPG